MLQISGFPFDALVFVFELVLDNISWDGKDFFEYDASLLLDIYN